MQRLPGQRRDELLVPRQCSSNLFPRFRIPQTDGAAFISGANLKEFEKHQSFEAKPIIRPKLVIPASPLFARSITYMEKITHMFFYHI